MVGGHLFGEGTGNSVGSGRDQRTCSMSLFRPNRGCSSDSLITAAGDRRSGCRPCAAAVRDAPVRRTRILPLPSGPTSAEREEGNDGRVNNDDGIPGRRPFGGKERTRALEIRLSHSYNEIIAQAKEEFKKHRSKRAKGNGISCRHLPAGSRPLRHDAKSLFASAERCCELNHRQVSDFGKTHTTTTTSE